MLKYRLQIIRILVVFIGLLIISTAVMTFSRTFAVKNVSAEGVDRIVQSGLKNLRGDRLAPHRPALGFNLDQTTDDQAARVMASRGFQCHSKKMGYRLLRCHHPEGEETTLTFSEGGRLKSLSVYRSGLTDIGAQKLWAHTTHLLKDQLGRPTQSQGKIGLEESKDKLDIHSYEYRFRDYYAKIVMMNKGTGKALYERYQSAL